MPHIKLTKSNIENIPFAAVGKQVFYIDEDLPRFGLRVGAQVKTFYVEKKINGKTKRVTIGKYGEWTPREARSTAQQLLGEMSQGIDPKKKKDAQRYKNVTLQQCFDEYLETRELKPKTVADYTHMMDQLFVDWKKKPMTDISKDMVAQRHQKIGQERGKALANGSMRLLRALFNFGMDKYEDSQGEPIIPRNPVQRLSQTKAWFKVKRRTGVLQTNQFADWYQGVMALPNLNFSKKSEHVRDYLLLVVFTGLRRREAERLMWENVDLHNRTITIPDTKNGETLILPMSSFVYHLLKGREQAVNGTSLYVFPGKGATGHLVEPWKSIQKIRKNTQIQVTIHDLRRTFATTADLLGISENRLKRLLNHKNEDVTQGYIIKSVEPLRDPMQRIADYLMEQMGVSVDELWHS